MAKMKDGWRVVTIRMTVGNYELIKTKAGDVPLNTFLTKKALDWPSEARGGGTGTGTACEPFPLHRRMEALEERLGKLERRLDELGEATSPVTSDAVVPSTQERGST